MANFSVVWAKRRQWLQAILIVVVGALAIKAGLMSSIERTRGIAEMKATGLGAYAESSPWRARFMTVSHAEPVAGQVTTSLRDTRKVVRTAYLDLIVASPANALERVGQIADQSGGYVVSSQINGNKEQQYGSLTVRVPASHSDEFRRELKKVAAQVESERTDSSDVTKQWVDNEARLRNYRAEEARYLEIMKRSVKVKDTLEVAEKLSDVRGRIETLEAEMRTLAQQVDMTAITVTFKTEAQAVAAATWRPVYWTKSAFYQGTDALSEYAAAMLVIIMHIPAVLAWGITILLGIKLGWIILKRVATVLGLVRKPEIMPAA